MTGYAHEGETPLAIHAYLSREAKDSWSRMSEDNGVSITGLMEALGRSWGKDIKANAQDAEGLEMTLVRAARRIDAERRRRGKR